jgi:hypothetical protein
MIILDKYTWLANIQCFHNWLEPYGMKLFDYTKIVYMNDSTEFEDVKHIELYLPDDIMLLFLMAFNVTYEK